MGRRAARVAGVHRAQDVARDGHPAAGRGLFPPALIPFLVGACGAALTQGMRVPEGKGGGL